MSSFSVQWQGRGGKVIIHAPSEIPHETIATAVTNSPDMDSELVDAILNKNYEFQTAVQTVTVERKDLESIIKGFYGLEEHPELSAFIEESESETLLTNPELRPGPSRSLPPVAITTNEDDASAHPTRSTAPTDTYTKRTGSAERSLVQKAVHHEESIVEDSQKVSSSAPATCAPGYPRQNPVPEHGSFLDTPMIGILSGECEMLSGSPLHSFMVL